jgi:hypothetical protein
MPSSHQFTGKSVFYGANNFEIIHIKAYFSAMKKGIKPGTSDIKNIRGLILEFACTIHDFTLEKDDFLLNGDWNSTFLITFKHNKQEDRLFCEAPFGEYFLRLGVHIVLEKKIWERESHAILAAVSEFDIAIHPQSNEEKDKIYCLLTTRAWLPNFNQRIFGLTFSNLLDCKQTVLSLGF